jgi:hypothetical protein
MSKAREIKKFIKEVYERVQDGREDTHRDAYEAVEREREQRFYANYESFKAAKSYHWKRGQYKITR